jgi:hypothetical protein
MKRFLLIIAAIVSVLGSVWAQQGQPPVNPPPSDKPPGEAPPPPPMLTEEEKQELHKAHDDALNADSALAAEDKQLRDKMHAAREAKQKPDVELMEALKAHHEKVNAAMIKIDPNVAPLIQKAEAAHRRHMEGAAPPPPPSA